MVTIATSYKFTASRVIASPKLLSKSSARGTERGYAFTLGKKDRGARKKSTGEDFGTISNKKIGKIEDEITEPIVLLFDILLFCLHYTRDRIIK